MGDANTDPDSQRTQDIEIFKIVTEHFRQDVHDFWLRANFYLLAQSGLFSAFMVTYPALTEHGALIIQESISILGLATAILWFIVLRNSLHFVQKWREQVIKLDKELDRFQCYVDVERLAKQRPYSSPSYVTQFLALAFVVAWAALSVAIFIIYA